MCHGAGCAVSTGMGMKVGGLGEEVVVSCPEFVGAELREYCGSRERQRWVLPAGESG